MYSQLLEEIVCQLFTECNVTVDRRRVQIPLYPLVQEATTNQARLRMALPCMRPNSRLLGRGGKSKVAAGLASDRIAELAKDLSKIAPGQIAGEPHTAIISSRT